METITPTSKALVIELLSSSPPRLESSRVPLPPVPPATFPLPTTTEAPKLVDSGFHFLSDDFDSSVRFEEDVWEESAAKRRRVSSEVMGKEEIAGRRKDAEDQGDKQDRRGDQIARISTGQSTDDEIIFTSSLGQVARKEKPTVVASGFSGYSSDDDFPNERLPSTNTMPPDPGKISNRTAKLLQALDRGSRKGKVSSIDIKRPPARARRDSPDSFNILSDSEDAGHAHSTSTALSIKRGKSKKLTVERSIAKGIDTTSAKEARATQKAKNKEEAQDLKRIQRAQKAKDKEIAAALADANKLKKDKKESTKEMIVDLPLSLQNDNRAQDAQIREMLRNLGLEPKTYASPIPHVIKWRRKVDSRFDAEKGYRVAIPTVIEDENHVMVILSAKEFVGLITAEAGQEDLNQHVRSLKSSFTGCTPIYMIEGLRGWLAKNKNARNRAFRDEVLTQEAQPKANDDNEQSSTRGRARKPKAPASIPYIDEDIIEDALLKLQVQHDCRIHHTITRLDTAEWVANFTQHISTIPYK